MAPVKPANLEETFSQAALLHQSGKFKEAARLYQNILSAETDHFDAHHMLGVLRAQQGQPLEAVKAIAQALKIRPHDVPALCNFGNVLRTLGQLVEALASYDKALSVSSDAVIWYNRGLLLAEMRRPTEAISSYDQALRLHKNYVEAILCRAAALRDLGRWQEALAGCESAIAIKQDLAEAYHIRGNIQWRQGQLDSALDSYNLAAAIATTNNAEILNGRGLVLTGLERHQEALKSYDEALAIHPGFVEALNNRGNALASLQHFEQALENYDKVLALKPDYPEALNNRGAALVGLQRFDEALSAYAKRLQFYPGDANAHYNRGVAMCHLQRFSEALQEFDAALTSNPRHPYALSGAANAALNLCDWPRVAELSQKLVRAVKDEAAIIAPFTLLGYGGDLSLLRQCAGTYLKDKRLLSVGAWYGPLKRAQEKLRIAYVSSDFCEHPVAYNLAALMACHEHSQFEIHGVCLGANDGSAIRTQLVDACDQFHDVALTSNRDAVRLLRRLEIDIAVDLNGYTQYARPGLLAARIAPVQVNYLGYPGTTAMEEMDYLIADRIVAPFAEQAWYSEAIVHLPGSYLFGRNPSPSAVAPTRDQEGLPQKGIVFCCFAQSWKISQPLFDIWMRLLAAVPESVLWLREPPAEVRSNFERQADARNVPSHRLVWAKSVAREHHLARLSLADLVLDTLPYNGHVTTVEALAAGVAVVSCVGQSFAGRVAASLLHAAELSELVAATLSDYENVVLRLARNPDLMAETRQKASRSGQTVLFDTQGYARNIEVAYLQMWARAQKGEKPSSFSIVAKEAMAAS